LRKQAILNRIKRLEPNKGIKRIFAEICVNDPHIFHREDHRYFAKYSVIGGYTSGICCVIDDGFVDSLEEGLEAIKTSIRKYTLENCDIYHSENVNGSISGYVLKTIYELSDWKLREKQSSEIPLPYVFNSEHPDKKLSELSDLEWVSFFKTI